MKSPRNTRQFPHVYPSRSRVATWNWQSAVLSIAITTLIQSRGSRRAPSLLPKEPRKANAPPMGARSDQNLKSQIPASQLSRNLTMPWLQRLPRCTRRLMLSLFQFIRLVRWSSTPVGSTFQNYQTNESQQSPADVPMPNGQAIACPYHLPFLQMHSGIGSSGYGLDPMGRWHVEDSSEQCTIVHGYDGQLSIHKECRCNEILQLEIVMAADGTLALDLRLWVWGDDFGLCRDVTGLRIEFRKRMSFWEQARWLERRSWHSSL